MRVVYRPVDVNNQLRVSDVTYRIEISQLSREVHDKNIILIVFEFIYAINLV